MLGRIPLAKKHDEHNTCALGLKCHYFDFEATTACTEGDSHRETERIHPAG